jgi:restriction system protein
MPPLATAEFIGQIDLIERIDALLLLHGGADWLPGHMLFQGENGSGRRSLARALASALRVEFREVDASSIQQSEGVNRLLTNISQRSVLCVANLEALEPLLQDRLASALKTVANARPLTCVVCATPKARITPALRQALPFLFTFAEYSRDELLEICLLHARKCGLEIEASDATAILGQTNSGQPGEVTRLVASVASLAGVSSDRKHLSEALIALGVKDNACSDAETKWNSAEPDLHTQMQRMSGYEFERFITSALVKLGFHAEATQASGDGGIDIVAHFRHPLLGGKFVIQCKRYLPGNNIGRPTLQEFCGAVHTDKEHPRLVFITTSSFTKEAQHYARGVGIQLIDGDTLVALLDDRNLERSYGHSVGRFEELANATKFADGGHDISDQGSKIRIKRFDSPDAAQTWALSNRSNLYGVELWRTCNAEAIALFVQRPPQRIFQDS